MPPAAPESFIHKENHFIGTAKSAGGSGNWWCCHTMIEFIRKCFKLKMSLSLIESMNEVENTWKRMIWFHVKPCQKCSGFDIWFHLIQFGGIQLKWLQLRQVEKGLIEARWKGFNHCKINSLIPGTTCTVVNWCQCPLCWDAHSLMVLMSVKLTCWDVLCFAVLIALTGQLNDKKDNATTQMSESTMMTERHNFFMRHLFLPTMQMIIQLWLSDQGKTDQPHFTHLVKSSDLSAPKIWTAARFVWRSSNIKSSFLLSQDAQLLHCCLPSNSCQSICSKTTNWSCQKQWLHRTCNDMWKRLSCKWSIGQNWLTNVEMDLSRLLHECCTKSTMKSVFVVSSQFGSNRSNSEPWENDFRKQPFLCQKATEVECWLDQHWLVWPLSWRSFAFASFWSLQLAVAPAQKPLFSVQFRIYISMAGWVLLLSAEWGFHWCCSASHQLASS